MFKILVTDAISDTGLQALYENTQFTVDKNTNLTPEEIVQLIGQYDGLVVRSQTTVTKEIIEHADNLKVIARAGVGVDNIDIDAATKKGIIVINAPGGNTIAAAEHTVAMLLSLARKIPHAHQSTTKGEWKRGNFKGVELYQKTLGIIGMGKIGSEVAKRAKSFDMNILAFDPFLTEDRAEKMGITKASLDDIAAQADFITLHTPLTDETRNLVNDAYLAKMKKGVRIVNCARGGIIDEEALVRAVNSGHVAGAALDVFSKEPIATESLLNHPDIIVTPHLGASTEEAQEKVAQEVSSEMIDILTTNTIRNAVNMPRMSGKEQSQLRPYLELAEHIAQISIQLLKNAPEKIEIKYDGDLLDLETNLVTRTMIKEVLAYHLRESVNVINVLHLLKEHDIAYVVQKNASQQSFNNYIELTIHHGDKQATIGGTIVNGFGPRIVKFNDYRVDVTPDYHLLYVSHQDIPGSIGKVGSVLGDFHINIGTMQVGRETVGGEAIMILSLDKAADALVLDSLRLIAGIGELKIIELPTIYPATYETV